MKTADVMRVTEQRVRRFSGRRGKVVDLDDGIESTRHE